MSNKKITAVEWLAKQYEFTIGLSISKVMAYEIEQAKEMERAQIEAAEDKVLFDFIKEATIPGTLKDILNQKVLTEEGKFPHPERILEYYLKTFGKKN
jgi:hypothetical protein